MEYRVKNNNVFQGVFAQSENENTYQFIERAGNYAKNRFDAITWTYHIDNESGTIEIMYLRKGDKKYNYLTFDKI